MFRNAPLAIFIPKHTTKDQDIPKSELQTWAHAREKTLVWSVVWAYQVKGFPRVGILGESLVASAFSHHHRALFIDHSHASGGHEMLQSEKVEGERASTRGFLKRSCLL